MRWAQPSSTVLTNIIAEVLAREKLQDQEIRITIIGNKEIKGPLFADDVSAYPENTNESTD